MRTGLALGSQRNEGCRAPNKPVGDLSCVWPGSTMTETIVRGARRSDLDALLTLYRELAEDRSGAAAADAATSDAVFDVILKDSSRTLAVADVNGKLVGTIDLLIVPNLTHSAKSWAVVENVVVTLEARRRGVATHLMRYAIDTAQAAGCYKVQLHSGKQPAAEAHEFYRRLGFDAVAEGFKLYLG
jgi:GNAT superfamily N-acetyltransferase